MSQEENQAKTARALLGRKIAWSRLILVFERVWPRLWPPLIVLAFFLIVSLFGFWASLPNSIHMLGLALFGLGMFASFFPLIRMGWPSRDEALRRLEKKSGLPHRPASSYFDTLSLDSSSKTTTRLWQAHLHRLTQLFAGLKAGWPSPRVDRYDPFAVRALVLLLLPVAFLWAGDSWRDRIASAFRLPTLSQVSNLRLDAWVTPPLYTGKPPILLADGSKPLPAGGADINLTDVPEKSVLIIRLNGDDMSSVNIVVKNRGDNSVTSLPKPTGGKRDLVEYKVTIASTMSINVRRSDEELFGWNFNAIKDKAPIIALKDLPKKSPRSALELFYEVEDDYGVVEAQAQFTRPAGQENAKSGDEWGPLGKAPDFPLNLPHANIKKADGKTFKDLTSHPWAGLEVLLTLSAKDHAGQEGKTTPIKFVLPERVFTKPFARAIIEQRRKLVQSPKKNRSDVMLALDALSFAPEKFIEESIVYLGIRTARWRLKYDRTLGGVVSVVDQLWDVALRIEDGDLSDAERALKIAEKNLERALKENAPDKDIKKAIEELKVAIAKYLQALAKQAANKNLNQPNMENQLSKNNMMSPKDLEQMLKNIEDLAKSGSKEMAQQMLSELKSMLENLQASTPQQNKQAENMMKMLNEMGDLIQKQQKLLDDTFEQKRRGEAKRNDARERSQQRQGQRQSQRPGQKQGQQQGQQGQRPGQKPGQGMRPGQQGQQRLGERGSPRPGQSMRPGQGRQPGKGGQQFGQSQQPGQQGQRGMPGKPGGQGENGFGSGLSQRQDGLRETLEKMLKDFRASGGKSPGELGEAERAMGDAHDALGEENMQGATQQQNLALDRLRKSARKMAQQMMQAMKGAGGKRGDRDPLGRRPRQSQGPDLGTSVKVPDEIDIQRARQILEELRQRLSEPTRPDVELEYIERLLKRF